jgi:hypothetical protein
MLPLDALATRLVQLHTDVLRDRGQVAIAGAGVAVTAQQPAADAARNCIVIQAAMSQMLGRALPLEAERAERLVDILVTLEEKGALATIRVCGSELVGVEDLTVATDRARAMRAHLVAELQRALSDEPPVTRRSAPPSSAEAR